MNRTAKLTIGAGALAGAIVLAGFTVLAGGALAQASGSGESGPEDESESAITGAALDQASAAALAHTGEGTVTGTEVGDEESYYEVEVTLDDGSEVDVQLDENFTVVGADADGATED